MIRTKWQEQKLLRLLENFYLPLFYGAEVVREYRIEEKKYHREEAKAYFAGQTKKIMAGLSEKGVKIIEKNITMRKDNVNWYLHIEFAVVEKAGKSMPTSLFVDTDT